jgi:hypothetical protein
MLVIDEHFILLLQVDEHGVKTGPDLDEEMEKVFAMADEDRFDVAKLAASPDSNTSKRSLNEKDYSCKQHLYLSTSNRL